MGPRSDPRPRLQSLLEQQYHATQVALVGSGTQALTEAIRTAAATTGRAVALPAFGCYDLASAAIGAGVRVSLYDLDPLTFGPDWYSLEHALQAGAGAIVIAYLYGVPIDWTRAQHLASRFDAALIEDAAQGMGGSWDGRPLGSLGPASVLSFGRGKGWTGGNGGALLLRGAAIEATPGLAPQRADEIRNMAGSVAQWLLARPGVYGIPASIPRLGLGETHFRTPVPATGISRTAAAMVLRTRDAATLENTARGENAARLNELLAGTPLVRVQPAPGMIPGFLRFPVLLRPGTHLPADAAKYGIARSYPTTLAALEPLRASIDNPSAPLPGADRLAATLVTLPVHSLVTPADMAAAVRILFEAGETSS
jgi:dTDP-4-amino-4,6-dideoxygalactose transaminase